MGFCKEFNARTSDQAGLIIPVEITVFEDRSFTFITKTPPAAVLLKKAAGIESGSGEPNKNSVATVKRDKVREIAELKMPDLNAASVEAAMQMVEALRAAWESRLKTDCLGGCRAAFCTLQPLFVGGFSAKTTI